MKIGILISRIGGVDGVALETEKWMAVLKRMGHRISILTGKLERQLEEVPVTILPELDFHHPDTLKEQMEIFFQYEPEKEKELEQWLEKSAFALRGRIHEWLSAARPDMLIVQNASALPSHLRLGMALKSLVGDSGCRIPVIAHNHDFAWERGERYDTEYRFAKKIIADYFPLIEPTVKQVVINTYNQKRIREIYGLESVLIPNVMDFTGPVCFGREGSPELRPALGFGGEDVLLFQITRIVRRKNIEAAITLAAKLNDPKIKLVVTGQANDDLEGGYYQELVKLARDLGVEEKIVFAGRHFKSSSSNIPTFTLEDAYAHATACTYFSLYEGFGNAFTEAVLAGKPVFVNNYQPVYWDDIGSKGFKTVQIEEGRLTDEAVEEIREVLADSSLRREMTEHNFRLGAEHFSFEVLERKLRELLD